MWQNLGCQRCFNALAKHLLGKGVPVCCVIEFELVNSAEFRVEVLGRCELRQVWVESDLFPSDGIHGSADHTKERVDPPPYVLAPM